MEKAVKKGALMVATDRRFELTTTLTLPILDRRDREEYARQLADAIGEAASPYPAITAYFAEAEETPGEITVGLRFELVDVHDLDDWASEVLEEAIEQVSRVRKSGTRAQRESSVLVPA